MDIYAINSWDAKLYIIGAKIAEQIFGNPLWWIFVAILTLFAGIRAFVEIRDTGKDMVRDLFLKIGGLIFFSLFTLFPMTVSLRIYTVTKSDAYTNVFKWTLPSEEASQELRAEEVLSYDIPVPPVVALVGEFLGYFQFWSMWLIDKAGVELGGLNSVSSSEFLAAGKIPVIFQQASQGIDGIVADLQDAGEWEVEDQDKYVTLKQDLSDLLRLNCVDRKKILDAYSAAIDPSDTTPSIDLLLESINPELSEDKKALCQEIAGRIKDTVSDFCSRWTSLNGSVAEVCENIVDVSLWRKVSNFFESVASKVKELPGTFRDSLLSFAKDLIINAFLGLAGLMNFVLLGVMASVTPLMLGIINLLIFFLSPLFFLTQLVQGKFVSSTVRILLEMLWARALYAVLVLAYVVTSVLQQQAWKTLLEGAGAASGAAIAKAVTSWIIKGGGYGMVALSFGYMALTIIAGIITIFVGAQILRTLIFGELMHIGMVVKGFLKKP